MALTRIISEIIQDNTIDNADISASLSTSISGSLGANADTIRTLSSTTVSGSFTSVSSSLAARLTSEEGEAEGSVISSSAQIATDISGSRDAASISGSFGNQRVGTTNDVKFANITGSNNISASGNINAANITSSGGLNASEIYVDDYIYHNDDPDTYIGFPTGDKVDIKAGGINFIRAWQKDADTDKLYFNYNEEPMDHIFRTQHNNPGLKISGSGDLLIGGDISGSVSSTGSFGTVQTTTLFGPVDDNFDIKSDKDVIVYLDTDNYGTFHKFQVFN